MRCGLITVENSNKDPQRQQASKDGSDGLPINIAPISISTSMTMVAAGRRLVVAAVAVQTPAMGEGVLEREQDEGSEKQR